MPTMLDAFFFEIGWRTDKFKKGNDEIRDESGKTRNKVDKDGKLLQDTFRRNVDSLRSLRNETVGLLLAFTGASSIKQFVTNTLDADAATSRLAGNLAVSGRELKAWEGVAAGAGGTAADAMNTFNTMVTTFAQARRGNLSPEVARDLSMLGLNYTDLQDPISAIMKASRNPLNLDRPDFLLRMRGIGVSDSLTTAAADGPAALQKLYDAQYATTKNFNANADAAIKSARALNDLSTTLTDAFRPAITGMAEGLTDFLNRLQQKTGRGSGSVVNNIGTAFADVRGFLGALITGRWGDASSIVKQNIMGLHDINHRQQYPSPQGGGQRDVVQPIVPGVALTSEQLSAIARGIPGAHSFGGGRSTMRNRQVNGVPNSQHINDQGHPATALDFDAPGMSVFDVQRYFAARGAQVRVIRHNAGSGMHFHVQAAPGQKMPVNLPNATPGQQALLNAGVDPRYAAQIAAARHARAAGRPGGTSTTTVTIGTINTQAKDAKGIADTLPGAIKRRALTTQANSGLN